MTSPQPILRLESITKSFGEIEANKDINLTIKSGTIFALLGENGAGKSTLISVLSGLLLQDSGTIYVNGKKQFFTKPDHAIKAGIGTVHQKLGLVETMSVAENIFLSNAKGFFVSQKRIRKEMEGIAKKHGIAINPDTQVSDLSLGEKQQVEILKLLHRNSKILIFDEATTLLTEQETSTFFDIIKKIASDGRTVILVTHKLDEVIESANEFGIMKRGTISNTLLKKDIHSKLELAEMMFEHGIKTDFGRVPSEPRQIILKVDNLCCDNIQDINLHLRKGEIVSIIGSAGNGQNRLIKVLTGSVKPVSGSVSILGQEWAQFFAEKSWDQSLSYIPEDRVNLASCTDLDLVDNFLLTTGQGFVKGGLLQREKARAVAKQLMEDFNIQAEGVDTKAGQLSGGNLQKMVIARAFYCKPRLMVVEQPTQGLDVKATNDVWDLLLQCREQVGVLMVTSNLSEALTLSDRIVVMYEGKVVATFHTDDENMVSKIHQYMAGVGTLSF